MSRPAERNQLGSEPHKASRRFRLLLASLVALPLVLCVSPLLGDDQSSDASNTGIVWNKGPYTAKLGLVAEIQIPEGYAFTNAAGARRFMELNENPPSDEEIGLIVPIAQNDGSGSAPKWFLLFEFEEIGHVSDSEKSSLDADKILGNIKKGTEAANDYRKKKGWEPYHVIGWQTPPFYDERTHNLTWATLGDTDNPKEGQTVNYSTRILGRRGTMNVDLVLDPADLSSVLPQSDQVMSTFNFTQGSRYADFIEGDKVASYGLTALIAGGAAAAAVKSGLFAKLIAAMAALWKLILVGLAAIGAAIKRFFANLKKKITGEEYAPTVPPPPQESAERHVVSSDNDPR
jgi:uncharacterized membrane-anchored protein